MSAVRDGPVMNVAARGRAAAKWAARFVVERGPVELPEAQLLLALLAALPDQPTAAARGLEALLVQRGERKLA